jgi:hypothetical protein
MPKRRPERPDRYGFNENRNYLTELLGKVVPRWVARRAVGVSVEVPRREYERGEAVEFTVVIHNRLPFPVTVPTPQLRLWGWEIDGELEGSDETTYSSGKPGTLTMAAGETKRIPQTWNGRLKRTGTAANGQAEWVLPERGVHELSVFVATTPEKRDSVDLELY